jgi:hypothetical protein
MYIPRSITAELEERLLFNFRVAPEKLATQLPVPWLTPLAINGTSILSFCILHLKKVTIWPLPGSVLGWKTISCAYRCGILDSSSGSPQPAVWIIDRLTDLPVVARLSPWLLNDTLPMIRPRIQHSGEQIKVEIDFPDRQRFFKADLSPARNGEFRSKTFATMKDFSAFIHNGVTSYAASIFGDALTKIDLIKEDPVYEPYSAQVDFSWLDTTWRNANLELDSAVRAHGGKYRWNYRGLTPSINGAERPFHELNLPATHATP